MREELEDDVNENAKKAVLNPLSLYFTRQVGV